jgi:hypothetical protein
MQPVRSVGTSLTNCRTQAILMSSNVAPSKADLGLRILIGGSGTSGLMDDRLVAKLGTGGKTLRILIGGSGCSSDSWTTPPTDSTGGDGSAIASAIGSSIGSAIGSAGSSIGSAIGSAGVSDRQACSSELVAKLGTGGKRDWLNWQQTLALAVESDPRGDASKGVLTETSLSLSESGQTSASLIALAIALAT